MLIALALVVATPAHATDIDRIDDLFRAVGACWHPPAGMEDIDVTVLFAIRADGTLIGEPHITHASIIKDADARAQLSASGIAAVHACTPVHISERMGSSIAGRLLVLHLNNVRLSGL